jgi:hypothetical protein
VVTRVSRRLFQLKRRVRPPMLPAAIDTHAYFETSGSMYLHEPQFGLIVDVRYTRIRDGCLFGATWPCRSSSHTRSVGEMSTDSSPMIVVSSLVTPGYTRGGASTRRWAMMSALLGRSVFDGKRPLTARQAALASVMWTDAWQGESIGSFVIGNALHAECDIFTLYLL